MSDPQQRTPTYGPPPAAAYDQPWGPPAPVPPGATYPQQSPAYPPVAPAPGASGAASAPRAGSGLGVTALVLAVLAFVVAPIFGAIAGSHIGVGVGHEIAARASSFAFDLSVLSPVRGWVLVGEIAFWAGTALGVWALVQGIVALVKGRGRGAAIAAIVIAALGPVAFGVAVDLAVVSGVATGSGMGS